MMTEKGPKEWDEYELTLNRATDFGETPISDLDGELHPLFDRKRWEVHDEEYAILLPSMHLASRLIEVGLPWIANFLPSDDIFDRNPQTNLPAGTIILELPDAIAFREAPSPEAIADARADLIDVANSVRWQTNYEMYSAKSFDVKGDALNWMGITRLVDSGRPWEPSSYEDVLYSDSYFKQQGELRRPLIIGIMGEYLKAIKYSMPGSEPHLRATFMAAITMTHEIGHAVFHQDFRSLNPPFLQEPCVGNECSCELGFSFISWIFSGYHPQVRIEKEVDFSLSMFWDQRYTKADNPRPLYKTLYSIPTTYAADLLSQKFWEGYSLKDSVALQAFLDVRALLAPVISVVNAATARTPNWIYSHALGEPEWKDPTYNLEGFRKGNRVEGLTDEEIQYVKERTVGGVDFSAGLSEEQIKEKRRLLRLMRNMQSGIDEGDEEEEFAAPPQPLSHHVSRFDIEDGILECDVDPPLEDYTTPVTRIEVNYLFGTSAPDDHEGSTKRPRSDESDDEELHHGKRTRRDKIFGQEPAMYKNLTDFLSRVTPQNISSWTRLEAHNFCKDKGLQAYRYLLPQEFWQNGQLDLSDPADMGIVQRICEFKLQEAIGLDMFAMDIDAIIRMKEASLPQIARWDAYDLTVFCQDQGLSTRGHKADIALRVHAWRRTDIDDAKATRGGGTPPPDVAERDQLNKPENWTYKDLMSFIRSQQLPEWGTRNALIARAQRCQRDDRRVAQGESRLQLNLRSGQPERTDPNGFELYRFKTILGQSSVTALKSALFIAGNFKPDAELKLFFYPDESDYLSEGRPLSSYVCKDWKSLRLKVSSKWRFGPGSLKDKPIDLTGPGRAMIEWDDGYKIQSTDTPMDPTLVRAKEIANGAPLTVAEMFGRVTNRIPMLDRFVQEPTHSGPPIPRDSGVEILEEVEDYEEDEERREKGPVDDAHVDLRTPEERAWAREHSHMRDIYFATEDPQKFKNGRPEF